MKLTTILRAYQKCVREMAVNTSIRPDHDWGISVEKDWHAMAYQRRDRQSWTFFIGLDKRLQRIDEESEKGDDNG